MESHKDKTNNGIKSFVFWQRWLFYSSLVFALFGIVLAVASDNPLFTAYNHAIAHLFWHKHRIPMEVKPFLTFISAPLGATIACSYILLAFLAWFPFKKKQAWARDAIVIAFGTWIVLDSAVCIYYGAYFQVYFINAFSFFQKALPLYFTWGDFDKSKKGFCHR